MGTINSISVADFLERKNNNLDVFRIIAALMVIIGHSYVLFPSEGEEDLVRQLTGFTYSGALAVKIFFFISGMVVTNSILSSNSIVHFAISRFFRIFPALVFLCLVTAFAIGPALTTLNAHDYFSSPMTFSYLKNNILLKTEYNLPGLFADNKYPNAVNGSLWTLPYEFGCYMLLLGLFAVGVLRSKSLANVIFGIIIVESVLPQRLFTYWISDNPEILPLPACFAIGATLAVNKEKLKIDYRQTLGFFILTYLVWNTRFADLFFSLLIFSVIVNLAHSKWLLRLKIKNDISYGIYLWGFLVQQVLQHYIKGQTVYLKMFLSGVISVVIAYLSWVLIEKKSIGFGRYAFGKLNARSINE